MNNYPPGCFDLKDRVALVTGGGRGNGAAIGKGLLRSGAIVYFMDLCVDEIKQWINNYPNDQMSAEFVLIDITNTNSVGKIIKNIYDTHGRLDILVNNAGVTFGESSEDYSQLKWRETLTINLDSPFFISQEVFPYMKLTGGGSIVNITSLAAEYGMSKNPAYCATKGGLKSLTKALAKDWAVHNIRVNNLGLGYFRTAMTRKSYDDQVLRSERTRRIMMSRWGDEEDLMGPAVFLCSDASQYMTGQDLYIDGGLLANGV